MCTRKFLIVIFFLFLSALRVASTFSANVSFFLLAIYAMLGRREAIQAIAMSWFFTMISPGIAPPASLGGLFRYVVFTTAFLSIFIRSGFFLGKKHINRVLFFTLFIGFFIFVHSVLFSPIPDVSILKIVSWLMVTVTLLLAWVEMSDNEQMYLFKQLYNGLIVIMLISIPLIILPLGYLRNGTGFQGILNHPQAFGPTMAILGAISGSRLFSQPKPSWGNLGVFAGSLVLILLSEARTAGVALILGLVIGFIVTPLISGRKIIDIAPALKSRRLWMGANLVLIISIIFSPIIYHKTNNFITKSGRAGDSMSLAEAYDKSRGGLIKKLLENIQNNPVKGIGFGIASDPFEMIVERDSVIGLPVGAPIEKGVLPLAIIEELGLVGALFVFIWFWLIIKRSALNGITPLSLALTILFLNLGESTFFSPGGLGGLLLIFITWASIRKLEIKVKKM